MLHRLTTLGTTVSAALLSVALILAFVHPHAAEANGGRATERTQLMNNAELAISSVQNTITAGNTGITAGATTGLLAKEGADSIAFHLAKRMVSNMTRSLINWINSGFEGSPSFVTDLNGLLLDTLDEVAGEYIQGLGGIGEFICSPFRLDVQVALAVNYAESRTGMPSGPTACTLTGVRDNIENFLSGTVDNWGQWLSVTSDPQNTPYGAYLEAEAKLNARLINAEGNTLTEINWGEGFLSKKVCETTSGGGEECRITTPGQVISEALTFQLSTGPRTLIEADEINEIISALINQLALQALEGINGLLGLSEPGADGQSYLDEAVLDEPDVDINLSSQISDINANLSRERAFLRLIDRTTETATDSFSTSTPREFVEGWRTFLANIERDRAQTEINICELNKLKQRYDRASSTLREHIEIMSRVCDEDNPPETPTFSSTNLDATGVVSRVRQRVILDYMALMSTDTIHTATYINQREAQWERRLRELQLEIE